MTRADFIRQIEDAADHIDDIPREEIQILLRRAALRLRNKPEPPSDEWVPVVKPNWGEQ